MFAVKNTIRYSFVASEFINIFCTFAGAIYTFWESHQDDDPADINWEKHCATVAIALFAATISAYTANYFQGKKIIEEMSKASSQDETQQPTAEIDPHLTRSWTASILETGYVLLEFATTLCSNYFDYVAGKAWFFALAGSGSHKVFAKTHLYETLAIAWYSLLVDTPFEFSNGVYETSCEIHQIPTLRRNNQNKRGSATLLDDLGSDDENTAKETDPTPLELNYPAPLLASLLKYTFASSVVGRAWVKYVGTASHTLEHLIGLVLNIPATFLLLLAAQPQWLATFLTGMTLVFAVPVVFNVLQTYLFEGLISDKNLENITKLKQPDESSALLDNQPDKAEYQLEFKSLLAYYLCKGGLYSQGPYHGLDTCMPVVLFMRHVLLDESLALKLTIIIPLAILIFAASWAGSQLSEIKHSIEKIKYTQSG